MIKTILVDWLVRLVVSPLVIGFALLAELVILTLYFLPITNDQLERASNYIERALDD